MTSLNPDQMKAFVRRHFDEFVDQGDPSAIHRNMTPDFLDHDGPGGRPADANVDERMMAAMLTAMPGIRVTIEDLVAEGDKVVCRNVWRWRDPASGKAMEFHGFVLWRFEDDRIAERWATVTAPAEDARRSLRGGI